MVGARTDRNPSKNPSTVCGPGVHHLLSALRSRGCGPVPTVTLAPKVERKGGKEGGAEGEGHRTLREALPPPVACPGRGPWGCAEAREPLRKRPRGQASGEICGVEKAGVAFSSKGVGADVGSGGSTVFLFALLRRRRLKSKEKACPKGSCERFFSVALPRWRGEAARKRPFSRLSLFGWGKENRFSRAI